MATETDLTGWHYITETGGSAWPKSLAQWRPRYLTFDTKLKPFSQAWLSFGGDYKLSGRLRINAEIKALQSNYSLMEDKHGVDGRRVQSFSTMKVTTMSPQFGLKFKLQ